ncbi:hypothetical protein GGI00_003576 [Coemansia sp. RSA 2681]|nr:hypothetical protein GGI00_003576 [Coemansia sp. RSA 2681]
MSARYAKVLTWHNVQLFAGGALLSTTAGYVWVLSHMERTEAIQRRLQQVQRHMYWSMAVTQRSRASEELDKHRTQPRQWPWSVREVNCWWNAMLYDLSYWAAAPGYLSRKACLAKSQGSHWVESEWSTAKDSLVRARRRAFDFVKTQVKWSEAIGLAHSLWQGEKAKWQLAHASAIDAVHPLYRRKRQEDRPTTSAQPNRTIE